MAAAFGAAPTGGGLFGSSPFGTPGGFGQQTPATPGFGAASQPATTSAFSFTQSTPAAATGSSLFGAATASPFGANPSPSPGLFGANSSPGLFASTTPSLFGASSTPSLFGGQTASAFGAQSASAFGTGLFGQTAASTTPSPFGATSAPAAASSPFGSLFSSNTITTLATTTAPTNIFGQSQLAQPQALQPVAQQADSAIKEITEIKAAYTPGNPSYKFQYLLLNVVDNPMQRIKPASIDEMRWRQALAAAGGPDNPDRLWPVAANGFKDLIARSTAQAAALDENSNRLKSLQDLAFRLAKRQGTELKQRAADIQSQHLELAARLLRVCRTLDALESRLAASIGYRADVARSREDKLSRQLAAVEEEVSPASLTSLSRRLLAVSSAAQLRSGHDSAAGQMKLDERSSAQLLGVLKDHAEGIAKLQALLKRDALDIAIMQQEMASDEQGNVSSRGALE